MIYKLVKGVPAQQLREAGLGAHFAQHDRAVYPADAAGVPWTAAYIQATGDPIADLHEDLAAEQKARTTYEHLIQLTDDPGIKGTLRFFKRAGSRPLPALWGGAERHPGNTKFSKGFLTRKEPRCYTHV